MKIVKADAKGRITGLTASMSYTLDYDEINGQVILRVLDPEFENAELVGDVKTLELFDLLNLDANEYISDDGMQIRELPEGLRSDNARFGLFLKRLKRDPQTGLKEIKNEEVQYDRVVLRLTL